MRSTRTRPRLFGEATEIATPGRGSLHGGGTRHRAGGEIGPADDWEASSCGYWAWVHMSKSAPPLPYHPLHSPTRGTHGCCPHRHHHHHGGDDEDGGLPTNHL